MRLAIYQKIKALQRDDCPFPDIPNAKQDPFDEYVTAKEMNSFIWVQVASALAADRAICLAVKVTIGG